MLSSNQLEQENQCGLELEIWGVLQPYDWGCKVLRKVEPCLNEIIAITKAASWMSSFTVQLPPGWPEKGPVSQ